MNKTLIINKINSNFRSWRVADARVVGLCVPVKNTNNGWLRLLPKWNTNKGTKRLITIERYQSFLFETSKYNYEENGINIYFPQNFTPAET